ncbi:MAG: glycosyltransferase family 4 protein [Elusimicrobiota bacterium]
MLSEAKSTSGKKIAIVHKNIISAGGAERYMRNLAMLFAEQGYNVSVYAAKCDIVNNPKIFFHKIKIIPFPPFLKILSFAVNSKREIQREKFDLIFGTGNVYYQDIYRLSGGVYSKYVWISLLKYRTFIGKFLRYVRRLLSPSHWLKLYIEKKIFTNEKTNFFICPSKIVADDLTEAYKIDGSKIKIIINGIDTKKFNADNKNVFRNQISQMFGFSDSDFIFLFVSSNHFLKGLEPLLDAFYLLNKEQKNAKMLVVGKGRETYFRKKSQNLQLSDFVKFVGWQQDIREFYKAADFFVYPSFYDPFPNVALESLACGTPIIVSSLTGASEILEDGKNGFVIKNPRDLAEILDKMRRAISIPKKELATMSINARDTAENFSNEKHIKKIMEFVRAICPS